MTQPPPWRMHYETYAPHENGNAHSRERLAGLERDTVHLDQRLTETIERIVEGEQRSGRLAHRLTNLEMVNSARSALELKLADLPDRTAHLEYRMQVILELAKKATLIFLLLLAMLGWLPTEAKQVIMKGVFPPGIAG